MKFIKQLLKLGFSLFLIIAIIVAIIISMSLSEHALYIEKTRITDTEISQVRDFIKENNPLYFKQGQQKTLSISEKQIRLFSKYIQNKFPGEPQIKVKLFPASAFFIASIKLPNNPISNIFGHYVNITLEILQSNKQLKLRSLEVGSIKIPDTLSNLFLQQIHQQLTERITEYRAGIDSLDKLTFNKARLDIDFVWDKNIAKQVKNKMLGSIFSEDMLNTMNAYTQHLSIVVPNITISQPSLTTLLQPMFNHAAKRSQNNDPVLENRALFIVLGAYMLNKNIPEFMGSPNAAVLVYKDFYLKNRSDLSKHFLVSAALTALADPSIAHAIGLEKEMNDSDGGSGFSFADLAADKAGVTLANTALNSARYARLVQQRLASSTLESDFMPDIHHLPEGLQNLNFKRIYNNTESADYKRVIKLIDQRIARGGIYNH